MAGQAGVSLAQAVGKGVERLCKRAAFPIVADEVEKLECKLLLLFGGIGRERWDAPFLLRLDGRLDFWDQEVF